MKLLSSLNHIFLTCSFIETHIFVDASIGCDMAAVSNGFATDQYQSEKVSFQMFMTKHISTDKEILYWYDTSSSKATLT